MTTAVVLTLLLVAPICAALRSTANQTLLTVIGAGWLLANLATYALYAVDKRRARAGAWRIPETTLQGLALLGGWPAAFLAQRRFRHKTSKTRFQVVFWLIVLVHELLAIDAALGWPWSRRLVEFVVGTVVQLKS